MWSYRKATCYVREIWNAREKHCSRAQQMVPHGFAQEIKKSQRSKIHHRPSTTLPAAAGSQQPFDATTFGTPIAQTAALARFADMMAHSFGVPGLASSRYPDAIIPGLAPSLGPGEEPLIFHQTFAEIGLQMAEAGGLIRPPLGI